MKAIAKLRLAMTLPLAENIVGGALGRPSKMPGLSWGISAAECNRGSELREQEDSVCASCYAHKGHYTCPSVVGAHERRLAGISHDRWEEAMAFMINCWGVQHFRWFDSGDLQSYEHLAKICRICIGTRRTRHWLPTHEVNLVAEYLETRRFPSNLTVRLSADFVGGQPIGTLGLPTSTVHAKKGNPVPAASGRRKDSIECLAHNRGNHCGHCRACWDRRVKNVSYPKH
jgi:hypothetical protein